MSRTLKYCLITIIIIGNINTLKAQHVSTDEAISVARTIYKSKTSESAFLQPDPALLHIAEKSVLPHILYYTIRFFGGGWVIVSADKRFYPVLGYSLENTINDESKKPDNFEDWMRVYESQMIEAFENDGPFFENMPEVWKNFGEVEFNKNHLSVVEPLLTSRWAQDGWHNELCPDDAAGYNGHAPVGCVALAMAKLMYYYRFPASGDGTMLYTPPHQGGVYGPQYVNFSLADYNYNDMTDVCREPNFAIAQLCYHAGVSVQTTYAPQSSGANVEHISNALKTNFRYLADDYLPRSQVPDISEWAGKIIKNLENKQPVIYRSSSGWGGHVYICDGYQDSTHFHFNWGWGGAYNGFFYINNITPGGLQLNLGQGAIFNIYPDTTDYAYPDFGDNFTLLSNNVGSFEDGSGPENYLPSRTQSWLINPVQEEITNILIEFTMTDTEAGSDLISIFDGNSAQSPLLYQFSGATLPPQIYSSGRNLFITFQTDGQNQANGFHANYYGFGLPFCESGHVETVPAGTLNDGSHYHHYSNNADCHWLLAPFISNDDSVDYIKIQFYQLDLACGDTLFVFDGDNLSAPVLAKFAKGDVAETIFSTTNRVLINFVTDYQDTSQGWALGWEPVLPVYCSDTSWYSDNAGVISDGSGQKNYVQNTDCYFVIDVPDAEKITINFSHFDLEPNYDYIKIFDYYSPMVPLIKLSGNQLPGTLAFDFNKLLIHFHTDYRDNFLGWEFAYDARISGIEERQYIALVYPNPAKETITICWNSPDNAAFNLHGRDGSLLLSGVISMSIYHVNTSALSPGVYFISIFSNTAYYYQKIVIY